MDTMGANGGVGSLLVRWQSGDKKGRESGAMVGKAFNTWGVIWKEKGGGGSGNF